MNPELKQRLIGAAVVTALATIFVPMLFDDPKENSGKTVTEISIPETPVKSTEKSANTQPSPASKSVKTPDAATDDAATTGDESVTDAEMVDDADAEAVAGEQAPVNEPPTAQVTDNVAETEQPSVVEEEPGLDTGPVDAAKTAVKKPAQVAAAAPVKSKTPTPIKTTGSNKPIHLPVVKPVEPPPSKPVIKTNPTKPVTPSVEPTPPAQAKKPELVRYTIYAGSFNQQENANKLMKSLREQGIPVKMETNPPGSSAKYRLKIGPSLDKKKATDFKAKLDKQGVEHTMVSE